MPIANDPRYDVLFVDTRADGTAIETLPLLLRETGGGLDFGIQAVSPFAGQLAQGDVQDKDLTRWTVRSQRDWRGGFGQEYAYQETDSFHSGIADTRFRNMILLPPAKYNTQVNASTDPEVLPALGDITAATGQVQGTWAAKTNEYQAARSTWSAANRSAGERSANVNFGTSIAANNPFVDTSNAIQMSATVGGGGWLAYAVKFTTSSTVTVSKFRAYVTDNFGASYTLSMSINRDDSGVPYTPGSSTGITGSITTSATGWVDLTASGSLAAGTYWLRFSPNSGVFKLAKNNSYSPDATAAVSSFGQVADKAVFEIVASTGVNTKVEIAQKITFPSTLSFTKFRVPLRGVSWGSGQTVTLKVMTDVSNAPGANVATGTIGSNPGGTATWIDVTLSGGTSLTGGVGWVVLSVDGPNAAANTELAWSGDANSGYGLPCLLRTFNGSWGAWGAQSINLYWMADDGPASSDAFFIESEPTRVRLERKATAASTQNVTELSLYLETEQWTGSPTLTASVIRDSNSAVMGTATVANPGSAGFKSIAFASFQILNTETYTIRLEASTPSAASSAIVRWYGNTAAAASTQTMSTLANQTYVWGAGVNQTTSFYYIFQTAGGLPNASYPYNYTHTRTLRRIATLIKPGAMTISSIRLYLKRNNWQGAATLTLGIFSDLSGPNTQLASISVTNAMLDGVSTTPGWVSFTISYVSGADYWIVLTPTAPNVGDDIQVDWYGKYGGGGSGPSLSSFASSSATDTGAYSAWASLFMNRIELGNVKSSLYYIVNNGSALPGAVTVNPVRFSGGWYVASGSTVYKFNTGTSKWDSVYAAGVTVTSLAVFSGKIYAALGDSNDMVESSNGTAWSATAGSRRYTYLRAYGGYLYAIKSAGGTGVLAYTNATLWTTVDVADSSIKITGLGTLQNEIIILSESRMFSLSSQWVYQIALYENEEATDNGRNALQWIADGRLYVPIRSGLNAYDGQKMVPTGPELNEGMTLGEQGRISAMAGTKNWLFAAIDAGTTGRSSIYAFNGRGWHCMAKANTAGRRIRAIGIESVTSASGLARLWWWEDTLPFYIELPALSDNPYQISGMTYSLSGELQSSRLGGELAQITKDIQSVIVRSEGCTADQTVDVYLELDGSGVWRQIGTVSQSPYQEIVTDPGNMTTKTTGVSCTKTVINISGPETTSDCPPGSFVRINGEVAQVLSVQTSSQFTLASPLSAAPAAGVSVYPSRPAGKEVRYKLVLKTVDNAKSPKINRISIRWQEQILGTFRMNIGVSIEDDMKCRTGQTAYPHTAAVLRDRLYGWLRRSTPFTLVAPDGRNWRVKVMGASESGWSRSDSANKPMRFKTVMNIQLDEV